MSKVLVDTRCLSCEHISTDVWRVDGQLPRCTECGAETERVYLPTSSAAVIQDSIEGGIVIRHGLVNADGSPRTFYSHSEIRRAEKEKNMVPAVRHVGKAGSDRSPHTTRWI